MNEYNLQVAELLVRLFAGTLFLFQGYDKLFKIKIPGVIDAFIPDVDKYHISRHLLRAVVCYVSLVEFGGGILLLAGFCTSFALYALGLGLLLISFALSYMQPMWETKHVLPRFALVILLLITPPHYRLFSLDHFLAMR